jgi:crossover junction endodeoxyribonuclease RuvC
MRVLAIDPGFGRLGIAIVEKGQGKEQVLFSDCLETSSTLPFPERLRTLGEQIEACISEYVPSACALERLYFNANQKTAMQVAEVRGMILHIASVHHLPIFEYTPSQIKVAVSGSGRSDKRQMMAIIPKLVQVREGKLLDDEYDAIAVGITCLASERNLSPNGGKGA